MFVQKQKHHQVLIIFLRGCTTFIFNNIHLILKNTIKPWWNAVAINFETCFIKYRSISSYLHLEKRQFWFVFYFVRHSVERKPFVRNQLKCFSSNHVKVWRIFLRISNFFEVLIKSIKVWSVCVILRHDVIITFRSRLY